MPQDSVPIDTTRRDVLRKAAYIVPAVMTAAASPSFASAGSNRSGDRPKKPKKAPKKKK